MNIDFIKQPALFERAFPKWGFVIWRGVMTVGIMAFVGFVASGALHEFAALRDDFSSKAPTQTAESHQPNSTPIMPPSQSASRSGETAGIIIDCGSSPSGFAGNSVIVGEMKNVSEGLVVHGDCVKNNDFKIHKMENGQK